MTLDRTGCKNGVRPDEYATFEHLNSRFKVVNKRNKIVLAHHKCNNLRAHLEEKSLPLLEIWYRASDYGEHLEFVPSNLKYLF